LRSIFVRLFRTDFFRPSIKGGFPLQTPLQFRDTPGESHDRTDRFRFQSFRRDLAAWVGQAIRIRHGASGHGKANGKT